ncbi:PREDICTED: immunoglobulin superfamily member 1-like [Nanorana parkeri]|uniref:immunoglobulin superfamily member 1-like n=1 Tax=Nanorana parkeri TaxID=125878 RepID=UPI0008550C97|nr:PREDICTED: immunoglobulin superfamily member 1-like [Nanorana parkeri]
MGQVLEDKTQAILTYLEESGLPRFGLASVREFDRYKSLANFAIKLQKSEALNLNVPDAVLDSLSSYFPFKWASHSIKYLGIFLTPSLGGIFSAIFPPFLAQMKLDLQLWTKDIFTWFDLLNKPILEVFSSDPNDVIIIGDTIWFHCKNATNAHKFYLTNDQDNSTTRQQETSEFAIADLSISNSGKYTCKYSRNTDISEPSEPKFIYVKDKYPPPAITVKPRKIVRPGEDITITCDTPYREIKFTIYKYSVWITDGDTNPFSYVIKEAGEKDVGQYCCGFQTKSGNKTQIQSDFSDPIMVQIRDLQSPTVSWEVYANDDKSVKIKCQAPVPHPRNIRFQLLNSSEGIEEEIEGVAENHVTFNISSPNHIQKKYYCIYAIRIGSNFARSAISKPVSIWGDDYTTVNIIRLLVSAFVLILLGVILVKHFEIFQETEESPPELPRARRMQAEKPEYTERYQEDADPPRPSTPAGTGPIGPLSVPAVRGSQGQESSHAVIGLRAYSVASGSAGTVTGRDPDTLLSAGWSNHHPPPAPYLI